MKFFRLCVLGILLFSSTLMAQVPEWADPDGPFSHGCRNIICKDADYRGEYSKKFTRCLCVKFDLEGELNCGERKCKKLDEISQYSEKYKRCLCLKPSAAKATDVVQCTRKTKSLLKCDDGEYSKIEMETEAPRQRIIKEEVHR